MNHFRKKKAIDTYSGKEVSKEQIVVDGYTPEEADEILAALGVVFIDRPSIREDIEEIKNLAQPTISTPPAVAVDDLDPFSKYSYDEWKCEIKSKGVYDKLKATGRTVKITPDQAELLNDGAINGPNSYANLYFKK